MTDSIIVLLTIVIACATFGQFIISSHQYKLNLFNERYKSFIKVKEYINDVFLDPQKALHEFHEFKLESMTVGFIYGDEVSDQLKKLSKSVLDLNLKIIELEDLDKGPKRIAANLAMLKARKNLSKNFDILQAIVEPYLDLPRDSVTGFLLESINKKLQKLLNSNIVEKIRIQINGKIETK